MEAKWLCKECLAELGNDGTKEYQHELHSTKSKIRRLDGVCEGCDNPDVRPIYLVNVEDVKEKVKKR